MSLSDAWVGVIGTLGGVIVGSSLEKWSKKGKLKFYDLHVTCSYSTYDEQGHQLKLGKTKINQAFVHFGVYNSSGETEIIRNIKVAGYVNNKRYDFDSSLAKGINILSKQHSEYTFELSPLNEQGLFSLIDFSVLDKIYFEFSFINRKDKLVKLHIDSIGLSQIFTNN
jgi:hypothetical protein